MPRASAVSPATLTALAIVAGLALSARAQAPGKSVGMQPAQQNLDFEESDSLGVPRGWFFSPVSRAEGFVPSVRDSVPHSGRRFASIVYAGAGEPNFATISQFIDAKPYRGRRIALSGQLRYAGDRVPKGGGARLWLRVDRKGGRTGFFDNMQDRAVTSPEWTEGLIVGEVAADADKLALGFLLRGPGRAEADSIALQILPDATSSGEAPRPLSARALANLTAFVRLLGYVQHFHPSEQAVATDWPLFAVDGVGAVESAANANELARVLRERFLPIAPTVTIAAGSLPSRFDPMPPPAGADSVVAWRHLGWGAGRLRSVYSSDRIGRPITGAVPDTTLPPPGAYVAVELGGGVWCRVPLTVFADGLGTLPRARGSTPSPRAKYWRSSAGERSSRLAIVALAWNVLRHFYPYWDVVRSDWSAALEEALTAAATDRDDETFTATLQRMTAKLEDGHARATTPTMNIVRVPLSWTWAEGRLVIDAASDAFTPGVNVGDEVTAIDGVPIAEAARASAARISGASEGWIRYRMLGDLAAPANGDSLALTLLGADGEARVVRPPVGGPDRAVPARPDTISQVRPGIWYVDLTRCREEQFQAYVDSLATARGLVYDMRGYPGQMRLSFLTHLADSTMTSARWHVPIVRYPDGRDLTFRFSNWSVPTEQPRFTRRVAFLTNGSAISYAETCLGIVEHYRLGAIVGEPTAGTNGNVNVIALPGGYSISFTGMKVLKHDGSVHHGVGIRPTVPASVTVAGIRAGRDEVLEKGIEVVAGAPP